MTEPTKRFDEWKRRQAQSRGEGGGGARPQPQTHAPQDRPQREPQQYREPQREPQQYREQPQQYREQAQQPQREPQQFNRQRQFPRTPQREPRDQYREPQREPREQYREPRAARPQQYREPQAQPQPRPQQREQPRPAQQYQDEPDVRDLLQQPQPQPQQEQPQQERYGEVDASVARDSARERLNRFRQMYNSNQQEKSQSAPSRRDSDRPAPREDYAAQEDMQESYYDRREYDDGYSDSGYSSDYSDSGYSDSYDDYADTGYAQDDYGDGYRDTDYSDGYDNDYYTAGDERAARAVTDARDNLDDVDGFDEWDDTDTDDADTGDMYPVRQSNFADMDSLDEPEDKEVENTSDTSKMGGLMGWLRRLTGRGSSSDVDTSEAVASMNRKLRQPQVIGIMGSKGGVGKTSKTQVIGSILAHYRTEGGVAAVDMDANSTLIDRMKPQTEIPDNASVHTFAHDDSIRSAADVNSYLVLNEEKLAVLAGIGRTGSAPLKRDELQRILNRLGEFYTLIILDFPGSAEVPVAVHALKVIDSMVYVAEITKSSLSATKRDLKRISQVRPELLSSATIILNHRTSGKVHIKNLEGHVEDFRNMGTRDVSTGASRVKVWETNYDPHIGIEGPIQISQLDPVNRTRYMQIAASIMDALPGTMPGYKRYAADHEETQRTEVHHLDD